MNIYTVVEKRRVGFFRRKTETREKSIMTFPVECEGGVFLQIVGYRPQQFTLKSHVSLISISNGGHYLFVYQNGKVTYLRRSFSLGKVGCVIASASPQVSCGWPKNLMNQARRMFPST